MIPPDFFTLETLRLTGIGATIGAGLAWLIYAWRDRDYLLHRWHMRQVAKARGQPFESYPELEGYSSHILTPQERSETPKQVAGMALVGALLSAPFQIDAQNLELIVVVGMAIFGIFMVLVSDDAEEVGVPADPYAQPRQRKTRWQRIKPHLWQTAFVGLGLLAFANHEALGLVLEIFPGTLIDLFWPALSVIALSIFIWRYRRGAPGGLDVEEEEEWDKETAAYLILALIIASIGLLAWLT